VGRGKKSPREFLKNRKYRVIKLKETQKKKGRKGGPGAKECLSPEARTVKYPQGRGLYRKKSPYLPKTFYPACEGVRIFPYTSRVEGQDRTASCPGGKQIVKLVGNGLMQLHKLMILL